MGRTPAEPLQSSLDTEGRTPVQRPDHKRINPLRAALVAGVLTLASIGGATAPAWAGNPSDPGVSTDGSGDADGSTDYAEVSPDSLESTDAGGGALPKTGSELLALAALGCLATAIGVAARHASRREDET
jgi:hypothetical protein